MISYIFWALLFSVIGIFLLFFSIDHFKYPKPDSQKKEKEKNANT